MAKDDRIWIWTGYGEGFWIDKEEYENTYRGSKGVKTGYGDPDPHKDAQIAYNDFDSRCRNISDEAYRSWQGKGDHSSLDKRIDALQAEISDYIKNNPGSSRFEVLKKQLDRLKKTMKEGRK